MLKRTNIIKTFGTRKIETNTEKEIVGINNNFVVDVDGKVYRID